MNKKTAEELRHDRALIGLRRQRELHKQNLTATVRSVKSAMAKHQAVIAKLQGQLEKEENRLTAAKGQHDRAIMELASLDVSNNEIIFTWTQRVVNLKMEESRNYWGFGDTIRGMIAAFQFCSRCEILLKVDIHPHPFSEFFEPQWSDLSDSSPVYFTGADGGQLSTFKPQSYRIYTNVWPQEPLGDAEKSFIKRVLTIKSEYKIKIPEDYAVLHVRLGDEAIKGRDNPAAMRRISELIKSIDEPVLYLISDSSKLLDYARTTHPGVHISNDMTPIAHVGYATESAHLRRTLDDFQLVIGAKKLYTYSVYRWISGFVYWASKCYDIPLVNLK
jgi:hypothetical protein